ncbi:MAG TPA: HDOD domain-containing protein [Chitinolyticbacter sp.]|nr:HDOD domain-containing protein [Chitinolyticbacter sp.]
MFDKLIQHFRRANPLAAEPGPEIGPVIESESDWEGGILRRRPIVDAQLALVGHEYHLHQPLARSVRLFDEIVLRELAERLVGGGARRALTMVTLSPLSADLPLWHPLADPEQVVLLFTSDDALELEQLHALRAAGYRLGFDGLPRQAAAIELADYLRIPIHELDVAELSQRVTQLMQLAPHCKRIASQVDLFEEYQAVSEMQFELIQGGFYAARGVDGHAELDAGYLRLIDALNLTRSGAGFEQIAAAIRVDPLLSFKLLRYVNSAASGLGRKVDSLLQAITVLGHRPLYRWLSLLMFSLNDGDPLQDTLLEAALTRARTLELLGGERLGKLEGEQLFLIGMFSYLEALLRLPMESIVAHIELPDELRTALLTREGRFGPWLRLAILAEEGDGPDDALLAECGVGYAQLNRARLEAQFWAGEVLAA